MDLSELKGIVALMQKSDLTELEIELKDLKLRLARPGSSNQVSLPHREILIQPQQTQTQDPVHQARGAPDAKNDEKDSSQTFASPMVGTFYRRPSPEDPEFVKVGDKVKKGDVLCIIEAMKVMNEIQSDVTGEIVDALVDDGTSVEFGQALFKIRPS